ncbi:Aspartate/methionine/tyrosine aminotransferase [Streptomyces sp. 2323.1]|uniref:aminotransferase class I/II-fold pyridoxal phosphate-dependent enzyme n=1 Tax=Streptomyces sp. 2323.1 TaxID=1938841 RepID=UPI000BB7DF51|nr:aminotransferase class I/II-fold pyridoxal phosphate-dependent enzyme [Streptomyces sp. 2323.1]SOE09264.1 Aspartate/methionine/tyrosine aminotransferase [Streptomyces sp. 2323.1]
MPFTPFALEEWQSRYEQTVTHDLADSGCHPVGLGELLGDDPEAIQRLLAIALHYPPVGGNDILRGLIAAWHSAAPDNVLVTVGAAEANAITVASLVSPGDHVVIMEPGYRQVRGCALNAGAEVDAFPLDPDYHWRPDLDALERMVRPDTKLIAVTNPNNPVGTILTETEMDAITATADRVGAWILADEVYRGTERLMDRITPSFWGRYDKTVCVGSLSKAFGLPGLRLGWLVAPPKLMDSAWRRHEYATISTSNLSMHLAETALAPATRDRLLTRNRKLIREGYARLQQWIDASDGLLSIVPPDATALGFVQYHLNHASLDVANALRARGNVLVSAGAHFGIENHLRITHGLKPDYLDAALDSIYRVLKELTRGA